QQREDVPAARKALQEVRAIQEKLHGAADWRVTDARLDLEDLERRSRLSGEQRAALKEATELNGKVGPLWRAGMSAEALPLARRAVELRCQVLGKGHRHYARSLFNWGAQYAALGQPAQAEPLYRQALEIYKQALGERHPDYASSLNNLAALYLD